MGNKISAINGVKSPNFFEPGNAVNEIWFGNVEIISRLPFGDSDMAQAGWPKGDYPKIPWRPFIIPLQGYIAEARKKLPGVISKLSRRALPPTKGVRLIRNAGLAAIIISPLILNVIIFLVILMLGFAPEDRCGRTPMAKRRIAVCVVFNLLSLGYLMILKYILDAIFVGTQQLEDDVNHWTKVGFYPVMVLGNVLLSLVLNQYSKHMVNCDTKRNAVPGVGSEAGSAVRCAVRANSAKPLALVKSLMITSLALMPGFHMTVRLCVWLERWY